MGVDSKQLVGDLDLPQEWSDQQVALLLKGLLDALVKEQQGSETTP